MSGPCSAHIHHEPGCKMCEDMMPKYEQMCTTEPMRGILAGLWKPKEGDFYIPNNYNDVRMIRDNAGVAACRGNNSLGILAWLPRTDQLMEFPELIDAGTTIFLYGGNHIKVRILMDKVFEGTIQESLLLAFGWTQGLKWEGEKWGRR